MPVADNSSIRNRLKQGILYFCTSVDICTFFTSFFFQGGVGSYYIHLYKFTSTFVSFLLIFFQEWGSYCMLVPMEDYGKADKNYKDMI